MTWAGPWQTPPIRSVPWDYTGAVHVPSSEMTAGSAPPVATYADLCEATDWGYGGNTYVTAKNPPSPDFGPPGVEQSLIWFFLNDIVATFSDYSPSLPGDAIGYEYESDGLAARQRITTMVSAIPLKVQNFTDLPMRIQARAQTTPPVITSGITFIPGAALAALPDAGHLDVPAGTDFIPATLTATVPGSVVAVGSPGNYFGTVLLHFDGQVSHVGPTVDQWLFLLYGNMTVVVNYQPRRYRFLYTDPPVPPSPPLADSARARVGASLVTAFSPSPFRSG